MNRFVLLLAFCQAVLAQNSFMRPGSSYRSPNSVADKLQGLTKTWVAGNNQLPPAAYRGGVRLEHAENTRLPVGVLVTKEEFDLPESFDAREHWPECPSLREVRDQGCCGSCWAVSAVSAMTDRWCVNSPDKSQFEFGAFDLLSCCHECGDGCEGGNLGPAWKYWVEHGVSSGGPYNSQQGCHPYPFDACRNPYEEDDAPKCSRKCQSNYNVTDVAQDRHFGRVAYSLGSDEERMKEDLFLHGPLQASFRFYADFKMYKSGVYRHVAGPLEGGHAVKVLGWGVENGVKYWLCANSWGENWGDKGFFKFVRGENHLNFESDVHAGLPHYHRHNDAERSGW